MKTTAHMIRQDVTYWPEHQPAVAGKFDVARIRLRMGIPLNGSKIHPVRDSREESVVMATRATCCGRPGQRSFPEEEGAGG